jgi:hypothetical protein
MLNIVKRVSCVIQWATKFAMYSHLLSLATLSAGVIEDEARIQNISDFRACIDTFRNIIRENTQIAGKNTLERAQSAVNDIYSCLNFWESTSDNWHSAAWDLYPKFTRAYSLLQGLDPKRNEQFLQYGFRQGVVDDDLNLNFLNAFQHAKMIPFVCEDFDPNYLAPYDGVPNGIEEQLNKRHTYVMLGDAQLNALQPILSVLQKPVSECIGTFWRVVNVRAWKTPPQSEEFGPSDWHTDCMPSMVLKIMFYPLGASEEKGTIALQCSSGIYTLNEESGAWILFKNSDILHKGVAPQTGERIAVEITIMPSSSYDTTPISAGQNVRCPSIPWQKPYVSKHPFYKKGELIGANIGGGPHWSCEGWVNLEEVLSSRNPHSFRLFPNCHFPIESDSVQTVYTSHALEHLNIPTVYRVLLESHRILTEKGDFVIKIPDYDKALDYWRRQDPGFFGSGWNIESVSPTWDSKGIYDCLDYRAAMIFCSFFNDAFGNPFGSPSGSDPREAYFGPPIVDISFLRNLIKDRSPSQITKELRTAICVKEKNFRFCHQSAWSREELTAMLNEFGFEIVSFDPNIVIDNFKTIPGIDEMRGISTFCWAKKDISRLIQELGNGKAAP